MGYGDKDFGNPWWSFIVPSKFKTNYCLILSSDQSQTYCKNILKKTDPKYNIAINDLVLKIYHNKDEAGFQQGVENVILQAEKSNNLENLAKQL
jgi:hypothetical protein